MSCALSSVDVSGTLRAGDLDKRLLRHLVGELAERYDLEATLDIERESFVVRFASARMRHRGANG